MIDALRFALPHPTHVFTSFSINTATPTMDDTLTLPNPRVAHVKNIMPTTTCEQNVNEHIVTIDFIFGDLVSQLSIFTFVFWIALSVCRVPFG
jgi:hypothetical protein